MLDSLASNLTLPPARIRLVVNRRIVMATSTPRPAPRRILCVEDDADYREVLRLVLEQDGYDVVTAIGFEDALRSINAGRFDLYILDRKYND